MMRNHKLIGADVVGRGSLSADSRGAVGGVESDSGRRPSLALLGSGWLAGIVLLVAGCGMDVELTEREYLARATVFERQGDFSSAIIEYKNAIRLNPGNPEPRWQLGRLYLNLKFGTSAEKELKSARSAGLKTKALDRAIAKALLMQGRFDDVLLETGGEEEVDPASLDADELVLRGRALVHLLRADEAEILFREALERQPGHPGGTLGLARVALESTAYENAEKLIRGVLSEFPDNIDGIQLLGDLHRLRGERHSALDAYSRVLELDAGNIPAHLSRAMLFIQLGRFDQAAVDADMVRKYVPDYPLANYIKAVTEYGLGNYDAAEAHLHDVIDRVTLHIPSVFLLAAIQYRDEKLQQAELNLQTVIDAEPSHSRAERMMVGVFLKTRRPQEALALLEKLTAASPDDVQLLSLVSTAYIQLRDYDNAAKTIERAATLLPDDIQLKKRLGLVHIAAGEGERAAALLDTVVDMGANREGINTIVALAGARSGAFVQAEKAAESLVSAMPESPLAYFVRAKVAADRGDFEAARRDFERAREAADGVFMPALVHLTDIDIKQGRIEEAEARYREVLTAEPKNTVALLELARLLKNQGKTWQAIDFLERARLSAPGKLSPHLLLIRAYLKLEQFDKAAVSAQDVDEAHRNDPRLVEMVGLAQMGGGHLDDAVDAFINLVALLPKEPVSHFRLAQAYERRGDTDSAIESIEAALKLEPQFLHAHELLVMIYREQESLDRAMASVERMRTTLPNNYRPAELMGDLHMQRRDFAAANQAYADAIAIGEASQLVEKRFKALRLDQQFSAAYEVLDEWLAVHPGEHGLRLLQANGYMEDGALDEALAAYLVVLEQLPEQLDALNNVAWLMLEREDPRALEYAERAWAVADGNPLVADTLGAALLQGGKFEQALPLLQAALRALPHRPDIRFHWIQALHASGRNDEAVAELEALLRNAQGFEYQDEAEQLLAQLRE